jgi:hypothetical protein
MRKVHSALAIDEEQFTKAFDAWMEQRPDRARTLKTFIAGIKPKLAEARTKGATYEELAAFLRQQGIECSISTLKAYLAVKRRSKSAGSAAGSRRRTSAKSPPPPVITAQPGIKGGLTDDQL